MIGDVIMIMIILTEESQEEALWRILRRTAIVFMPLSIVFIKYFRHIGLEYDSTGRVMFTGVTMHKNQLGILCAFVGIFLIWLILKKWPKPDYIDVGLLGGTVFLLFQSRSATSIVVFVIGILVFSLGMRWKSNPRKFSRVLVGFLLLVIVLQGLLLSMVGSSLVPLFFSATARDSSFTGRVPLWQDLIQIGSNKPILGFGFGGFWLGDLTHDLWSRHRWRPVSGHNGYIDVYLELGLVGLLLLSLLIIHTYKKTITSVIESHGKNILFMTYLIMILLHNFTESTIAQANGFLWLLFLVLTVNLENTDSLAETGLDSNISLPNSTGSELNPGQ